MNVLVYIHAGSGFGTDIDTTKTDAFWKASLIYS
jgi:hypothetical protein